MLTIDNLETVVDAIVSTIPELEQEVQYVIDDDQLTEKADAYKGDKHLLVCLVPSAQGFGEIDNSGFISFLQFFVLKKTDYKKLKSSKDFLQIFKDSQPITLDFLNKLIASEDENGCKIFQEFNFNSVLIKPTRYKTQHNGWEIQIDQKAWTY